MTYQTILQSHIIPYYILVQYHIFWYKKDHIISLNLIYSRNYVQLPEVSNKIPTWLSVPARPIASVFEQLHMGPAGQFWFVLPAKQLVWSPWGNCPPNKWSRCRRLQSFKRAAEKDRFDLYILYLISTSYISICFFDFCCAASIQGKMHQISPWDKSMHIVDPGLMRRADDFGILANVLCWGPLPQVISTNLWRWHLVRPTFSSKALAMSASGFCCLRGIDCNDLHVSKNIMYTYSGSIMYHALCIYIDP